MKHIGQSEATSSLFTKVGSVLLGLGIPDLEASMIASSSTLIEDLGMDSLKFVDLTVGLEDALEVDVFPMQEWVDGQIASGRPLSVGELVRACELVLNEAGERR